MKLQFKEQDFQLQAVKAIVDCFAKTYLIDENRTHF